MDWTSISKHQPNMTMVDVKREGDGIAPVCAILQK